MTETTTKPKLLIIATTFPRWPDDPGPAPFVFHHARALARHFEVTVLAPHHHGAALQENMDGVRVKRFRYAWPDALELLADGAGIQNNMRKSFFHRALVPLLIIAEFIAIAREVRRGYDYANSHWLVPSGLLAALVLPRRVRHLITVHAADYDLLQKIPGGKRLIKFMATSARAIVCVSPRFVDAIAELSGGGAHVVTQPMGVDTTLFRFDQSARDEWRERIGVDDEPLVAFVGKLSRKKGVEVLLRAAAAIKERGVKAKFVIVGDGELKPELTRLADELALGEGVLFHGAASNRELARLYSAADVVAVPSVRDPEGETEGMPVVILEALAAGRPVVATPLCSPPADLLGKGVTVAQAGDVDELARALLATLDGQASVDQEAVAKHDVAAVADRYAALLMGDEA